MTQQYNQTGINLAAAELIAVQTPDATPLLVNVAELTEDGQSLWILLLGGGSDPAAPSTNNYFMFVDAMFTRQAGVVSVGSTVAAAPAVGVAITVAAAVAGNFAQLSITGPAFPYNHRIHAFKTQF